MRFYDRATKPISNSGDFGILCDGYRVGIEEASGIVELEARALSRRGREVLQGETNLLCDGARRNSSLEGVPPEVAHEAAPRALTVGQKDRGDFNRLTIGTWLRLDQKGVGFFFVQAVARRPLLDDPAGACGW